MAAEKSTIGPSWTNKSTNDIRRFGRKMLGDLQAHDQLELSIQRDRCGQIMCDKALGWDLKQLNFLAAINP